MGGMKFWCVTAFMKSTELVPIARMVDEAGYHGMMLSDHIFYPQDLKSPYPYLPMRTAVQFGSPRPLGLTAG